MEDTFLMVREGGAGNDDPLNEISMALDPEMKLMPDDHPMDGGSAFRSIPDEAAGFEDALLRGGDREFEHLGGPDLGQVAFLEQSHFDSPQKMMLQQTNQRQQQNDYIDYEGFGLSQGPE